MVGPIPATFVMFPVVLGAVTTMVWVRLPLLAGMSLVNVQVSVFPEREQPSACFGLQRPENSELHAAAPARVELNLPPGSRLLPG